MKFLFEEHSLRLIALISAFVFATLFYREKRLVDYAGSKHILARTFVGRVLRPIAILVRVKLASWFAKIDSETINEYRSERDIIQSIALMVLINLTWAAFVVNFILNWNNGRRIDETFVIVSSLILFPIGHFLSSQLRRYITEHQSSDVFIRGVAKAPSEYAGLSATPKRGDHEMSKRKDTERLIPEEAEATVAKALESREASLALLVEIGVCNKDGELTEGYKPRSRVKSR